MCTHRIAALGSRVANPVISAVLKQDWRDSGRMRIIVPCGHTKFNWPTPYSLTASTASSAAARRVPAPSRPAHRDAAKTIPLRRIPQVRFSRFPGLDAPGAEHTFLGLNTLVDVSICRNFLRIDNKNSIAELTSFLNFFRGRSVLINYLFSIVYVYFCLIRQTLPTT